jgi:hypothetical protein
MQGRICARAQLARAAILVAIMAALPACLESQQPTAGQHLLVDRDITSITFSHAGVAPAGEAIVYFEREPLPEPTPEDPYPLPTFRLYAIPRTGGTPRLLVSGVLAPTSVSATWESTGRLLVIAQLQGATSKLLRVDPVSGAVDDFGAGRAIQERGDWLILTQTAADGSQMLTARRDDGTAVALGAGSLLDVVDDVFYVYVPDADGSTHDVHAITIAGVDNVIGSAVFSAQVFASPAWSRLLLVRPKAVSDGGDTRYDVSLRSLQADDEAVIAPGVAGLFDISASPDGSSIAIGTVTNGIWSVLVTSASGEGDRVVALPWGDPNVFNGYVLTWRPGTNQLWIYDPERPFTVVLRPGEPPITVERMAYGTEARSIAASQGVLDDFLPISNFGPFVGDGSRWLTLGADGRVHVSDSDDPAGPEGPPFAVPGPNPSSVVAVGPDSYVLHVPVADDRTDLYWSSPSAGIARLLGTRVGDVAYSGARLLALSKSTGESASADLTLYDLPSGTGTRIARNVSGFALAPCATCGPVDAGTPIVFAIRALDPYPFDGIWVGALP